METKVSMRDVSVGLGVNLILLSGLPVSENVGSMKMAATLEIYKSTAAPPVLCMVNVNTGNRPAGRSLPAVRSGVHGSTVLIERGVPLTISGRVVGVWALWGPQRNSVMPATTTVTLI
jgi:hypothetical protein